ncbi:ribosomal subunit interface protein [Candidatus Saccharibacteria bacterium]|nr:MAG: ribosomal subunit interface protein [Candidatus Saccharibacteria bacterium]
MIQKLEISGVHTEVNDKLRRYVTKKIGRLDRFVPRAQRPSLHAEVVLKESKVRDKNSCECDVVLHVPGETLAARESTVNLYAATDIVEAKLRNQLKKHKQSDAAANPKLRQRLMAKFRRNQPAMPVDNE